MPGTYSNLLLHTIFATRQRARSITPGLRPRLHDFMGGIIRAERGALYAIGGVEDHVHALIRWRTDESVAHLMRNLKARSSLWIHQTFSDLAPFAWQEGYAVFAVSRSQQGAVEQYIQTQEEHHRTRSFQEELIAFLDAHGVEYDPKYVFD